MAKRAIQPPANYLEWHYAYVPLKILSATINSIIFFWHFFSIGILIKTFLAPWKRQYVKKTSPGLDLGEIFERLTFNLISRVIGAMVRFALIAFWIILEVVTLPIGVLIFSVWLILPLITLPLYLIFKNETDRAAQLVKSGRFELDELIQALTSSRQGIYILQRLHFPAESVSKLALAQDESAELLKKIRTLKAPTSAKIWLKLAENWPAFNSLLDQHGYKPIDLINLAKWYQRQVAAVRKAGALWALENLLAVPPLGKDLAFGYTPTLDRYCEDLGRPLPYSHHLVGRTKTTRHMEQILSRSSGNNIVLVGEPGVGRNTIIEELAKKIKEGRVAPALAHRKVYLFGIRRLLSEKKSLAEAKGLIEDVLAEAAYAGNIVLVIENFDQFVSGGSGRNDLTSLFTQAVQKGVQIIGSTTPDDFARYLYPNQELLKHFQKIEAVPPSIEEARIILEDTLDYYEKHNKVFVTYAALKEIIQKVDRYVVNIPFPEKAIDLLDETCVWASHQKIKIITPDEVNKVISVKTKIPLEGITKEEKDKLANLEEHLHQRVVGQDKAIVAIARAMRRARTGVSSTERPIGSFLFMGPTGVGKTETAKALAEAYFGAEDRMIRFDMSEYQSVDALERIIGNTQTGEPGIFAKRLRDNPFSLVLLDEIEKTTSQVLNLLLTLLDEGYFTDAFGKKVDCRNLILIGTSNAGTELIRQKIHEGREAEDLEQIVVDHIQKEGIFSPEFINRFDAVVIYHPLTKEHLLKIAGLMLVKLNKRLKTKEVAVRKTEELVARIVELGYDPAFGARPMNRVIQDRIEDQVAQKLLAGELKKGEEIKIVI